MKNIFCLFIIYFFSLTTIQAQNKTESYIQQYSTIAVMEMNRYNIPASITLAQGILESGNGESYLAVEGNNHFGIKCHNNWTGETIIEDDDKENECFRKYSSVAESYRDHSIFLTERERYSFLFKFNSTEYKKWAKGLKKAGYATNPEYSNLLISLIEKYNLSRFDQNLSSDRKFFFSRSYSFPYLIGVGAYYFNQESIFYTSVSSSFIFSEGLIGYYHTILRPFFLGLNSGIIYIPVKDEDIVPQLSVKLMYKKNLFMISGGVQFPLKNIGYNQVPLIEITYLIE